MDNTGFQTVFVLVLLFVVAVLAFAVLILLEDRRTPDTPSSLTLIAGEHVEDETDDECPICHGMGVYDMTDDFGRRVVADIECWRCEGAGRIEVTA